MDKLIKLINNKTLEPVYPTTHTSLVLDNDDDKDIAEYVEEEIKTFNKFATVEINKIIDSNNKIKNLENRTGSTEEEKRISKEIVLIEDNKNKIIELNLISNTVQEKINNSTIVVKDIYEKEDIIEIMTNINNFTDFVEYGTPTTAPKRKRIMIDDENLYIGILNTWYVVRKN